MTKQNQEQKQEQEQKQKNLHREHRKRMRSRFCESGINGFHEHEILEMLLFYSIPQRDTNETAHRLLNKFGSLMDVLTVPREQLMQEDGIGEFTAIYLNFLGETFRFFQREKTEKILLETSQKRQNFFLSQLGNESQNEIFMIACLDQHMRLRRCSVLGKGNYEKVQINARTLAQHVLASGCSHVVIAHNHPMGSACPSTEDITATKNIKNIMKTLGVDLIDHIIVGDGEVYSMAEHSIF
ncbi:MAG: DNA repair protein RadC [Oscillospiraceae bacterium]|nr:DNA repair protein RadC [Oscillospiraceae bacterium]